MPLERDTLRRFVQAIMDRDPLYYDEAYAKGTKYGGAGRAAAVPGARVPPAGRRPRSARPACARIPTPTARAATTASIFGLAPIEHPFKRLLNGGNEIEFYRCLAVGERCVAKARYADVRLKEGKSGAMLLTTIETEFSTEGGELLAINRQTLIWR